MLMAILFCDETIVAATPACDHHTYGNQYWSEIHPADLSNESDGLGHFQTAYVAVTDPELRERLVDASIDDSINLEAITAELQLTTKPQPVYLQRFAA